MDAIKVPFMNEFASCWGILAGSLLIAAPVIFFRVEDHANIEDDLKFSDETAGDVGIPMQEKGENDSKGEFDHASYDNKDNGTHDNNDHATELPADSQDVKDTQPPTSTENKDSNTT